MMLTRGVLWDHEKKKNSIKLLIFIFIPLPGFSLPHFLSLSHLTHQTLTREFHLIFLVDTRCSHFEFNSTLSLVQSTKGNKNETKQYCFRFFFSFRLTHLPVLDFIISFSCNAECVFFLLRKNAINLLRQVHLDTLFGEVICRMCKNMFNFFSLRMI